MRVLNRRQLARIPRVDQGNLYLGETSNAVETMRSATQEADAAVVRARSARKARIEAAQARDEDARERAAQRHSAMLARSLRRAGILENYAGQQQGLGFVPKFGIKNPLLGFVDAVDDVKGKLPDYLQQDVMPAKEFNNHLTARDNKQYLKNKDYPLVMDARSDFGGYLVDEKGSADFSMRIVDDAKSDFGRLPNRRVRR